MKTIILGFLLIIIILGLLYYFKNVKEGLTLANPIPLDTTSPPGLNTIPPFDPFNAIKMEDPFDLFVISNGNYITPRFKEYTKDYFETNYLELMKKAKNTDPTDPLNKQANDALNNMNDWGEDWILDGFLKYKTDDKGQFLPVEQPHRYPDQGDVVEVVGHISFKDGNGDEKWALLRVINPMAWDVGTKRGNNGSLGKGDGYQPDKSVGVADGMSSFLGSGAMNVSIVLTKEMTPEKSLAEGGGGDIGDFIRTSFRPAPLERGGTGGEDPDPDGREKGTDTIEDYDRIVINMYNVTAKRDFFKRWKDLTDQLPHPTNYRYLESLAIVNDTGIGHHVMPTGKFFSKPYPDVDIGYMCQPFMSQDTNSVYKENKAKQIMNSAEKLFYQSKFGVREVPEGVTDCINGWFSGEWSSKNEDYDREILLAGNGAASGSKEEWMNNQWIKLKQQLFSGAHVASAQTIREMVGKPWIALIKIDEDGTKSLTEAANSVYGVNGLSRLNGSISCGESNSVCDGSRSVIVQEGGIDVWRNPFKGPSLRVPGKLGLSCLTNKGIIDATIMPKMKPAYNPDDAYRITQQIFLSDFMIYEYTLPDEPIYGISEGRAPLILGDQKPPDHRSNLFTLDPIQFSVGCGILDQTSSKPGVPKDIYRIGGALANTIFDKKGNFVLSGSTSANKDAKVPGPNDVPWPFSQVNPTPRPTKGLPMTCHATWNEDCIRYCNENGWEGCLTDLKEGDIDLDIGKEITNWLTPETMQLWTPTTTTPDSPEQPWSFRPGAHAVKGYFKEHDCWNVWSEKCKTTYEDGIKHKYPTLRDAPPFLAYQDNRLWLKPHDMGGPLPPDDGLSTWVANSTPGSNPPSISYIPEGGTEEVKIEWNARDGRWGPPESLSVQNPTFGQGIKAIKSPKRRSRRGRRSPKIKRSRRDRRLSKFRKSRRFLM